MGIYGSTETEAVPRTSGLGGGRPSGTSGQSSPVLAVSEANQSSLHQYISSGVNDGGRTRSIDLIPSINISNNSNNGNNNNNNNSLSPSFNSQHTLQGGSYNGREEQSAADHIVLYTLLRELCSLRMVMIRMYVLFSQAVRQPSFLRVLLLFLLCTLSFLFSSSLN